jgi:autotransporter translocation and assembly factor TamB
MKLSRTKKVLLIILIAISGLILLLFISINLPYGHRFITARVNGILTGSGIPIHITSISSIYPESVTVKGVTLTGSEHDTIIYAGEIQADFVPLALLKRRVIISKVSIGEAKVNFSRKNNNLNIAEAFSKGGNDSVPKSRVVKKPWEVSIGMADIAGISFQMNDSISGLHIVQKIGELKIEMNKMSLPEHTLLVHSLKIIRQRGSIKIDPHTEKKDTADSVTWKIGLDKLSLNDMNLTYENNISKQKISLVLDEASAGINKIDLKNNIVDLGNISFFKADLELMTYSKKDQFKVPQKELTLKFPWDLKADAITLEKVTFRLLDHSDSLSSFGITDLALKFSNLKLNSKEIGLDIAETMFNMDNGFSVKKMKGTIESLSGKTTFNLSVETANSLFNIESKADGSFMELVSNPFGIKKATMSVSDTGLSLKDLLCFKPELIDNQVFTALDKTPFKVNLSIKLQDSVISIPEISIEKDNIGITMAGKIQNAFMKGKEKGELTLNITDINVSTLGSILKEAGLIKDLPEMGSLSLTASLSGSIKNSVFNIGLISDIGKTDISGTFDFENDVFYAKSVLRDVMLGKMLRNPLVGSIGGNIEVKGSGLRHNELAADIVVMVDSVGFKGYTYSRTRVECNINRQTYNINLNIDDPNLNCSFNGSVNNAGSILEVKSSGSFVAQLNNLHLLKDTLAIEGKFKAGFLKEHNNIKSDLTIQDLKLTVPRHYSILPETTASFSSDSLKTILNANSDFFSCIAEIKKPFSELVQVIPEYKLYALTFIDSSQQHRLNRISLLPEMKADLKISQHRMLSLILNDTTFHFTDFELKILNNPDADKINYNVSGKNIQYKKIIIGNLDTKLTDSAGSLKIHAIAENCSLFSHRLSKISIMNQLSNNKGFTDIKVFEKPDKILYDFGISSTMDSNGITFSVPSKQLTMNGIKWSMDTPDLFSYNQSGRLFLISLKMHTDNSYFFVRSDQSAGLKTKLSLNRVDIATILPVGLLQGNPSGLISGNADFSTSLNREKEINTDLNFENVSWSDINYRIISLKSNFKSDSLKNYNIELNAILDSSKIMLKAVKPPDGNQDINAEFTAISVRSFQPFVNKFLSDLAGHISGKVKIISTDNNENINGELNFEGVRVRINTLNSIFKIPSDKISFTGKKLVFNSFRILDSLNNELFVDGSLNFVNKGVISSDLEIKSKNLQVMRSTEKENSSFYGNIFVDSRLSIKGPLTSPDLKGNILLAGGTEIFFREKENLALTETEKVLTFVNRSRAPENLRAAPERSIYTKTSIDATVKIDPATRINFQLTKRLFNIDLMIQGGGELNYKMLANKDITLSGKYEISDGTTDVKITGWPNKAFRISKGGYVQWDGKLKDPRLNIEAISKVHSSYLNPVDNKQRDADFNVTLKLDNKLSDLGLLFTINTPDQYLMSIINTLSPEEQMKQAITILLFGKVDLPGISTSSDYMTEQVNQLVASQLNQLTKTSISGIDISFGIDSYVQATQSGGQETKTSLSYEVKKALLNNRAQIEVSGRLNDANKSPGASDLSLNNVSFEYRLDSAGTIFLKVYNEHTYEDVFEGEVIKTGVGLTYRKNYPTLGDIWKKERKNKKQENQVK